jgi:hypothetical protein
MSDILILLEHNAQVERMSGRLPSTVWAIVLLSIGSTAMGCAQSIYSKTFHSHLLKRKAYEEMRTTRKSKAPDEIPFLRKPPKATHVNLGAVTAKTLHSLFNTRSYSDLHIALKTMAAQMGADAIVGPRDVVKSDYEGWTYSATLGIQPKRSPYKRSTGDLIVYVSAEDKLLLSK